MDVFLTVLGIIFLLVGIVGCLLPILPGPPLGYLSLVVLQFKQEPPFGTSFMVVWAMITIAVFVIDYFIPPLATKRFGGSKKGVIGSTIGLVIGLIFFPPVGLIIGAFAGAFIGEMIEGSQKRVALRAASGALLGFLTGGLLKLVVVFTMGFYFISSLF